MSDIVDWSDLPKSLFVIGARSADGVVFDVQTCSVPMALAPEVEYVRAAEITRLRSDLAAAQEREQRMREALALIAVVDQGCGGNLSFKEMAESAMRQARAALGEPQ